MKSHTQSLITTTFAFFLSIIVDVCTSDTAERCCAIRQFVLTRRQALRGFNHVGLLWCGYSRAQHWPSTVARFHMWFWRERARVFFVKRMTARRMPLESNCGPLWQPLLLLHTLLWIFIIAQVSEHIVLRRKDSCHPLCTQFALIR